jgi:DNA replication protein DnaC
VSAPGACATSTSLAYEQQATEALEQLGLSTARAHLETVCQQAAADGWSYSHFLGYLLSGELAERHRKTIALSLQFAGFPYRKRLSEFDFDAQPGVDRRLIEELACGRFLHEGRNVILLGPPGVGKTHLAIGLGVVTAELGHRVYFTSAVELARKLSQAMVENRLHTQMKQLTRPKLLILDEVGYLSLDAAQSALLFQVIGKRYENASSIVLTSNKSFTEWGSVFGGDMVLASAALDRLLHRCTVVNIRGESYRLKERKQAGLLPAGTAAGKAPE